jgi:signal transduction histidine kinase
MLRQWLADQPGSCLLHTDTLHPATANPTCAQTLRPLVEAAARTGTHQVQPAPLTPTSLLAPRYLAVAVPIITNGGQPTAIGAAVPLARVLQPVWRKERVILVYLLVNALVLAAVVFFRLFQSQVRPIDRMVEAAENYRGEGLDTVWPTAPTNALGRLAGSIQAMVARIEADRERLAAAVGELAEKNRQLLANQEEMVRAEKLASVGRLAAGLAHEIGNPLGVVQGYVQLLAMEGLAAAERADYAAKGLTELARVDRLIRQLLDHARAGRGRPEEFDVHDLLAETAESLTSQPLFAGIRVTLDLAAARSQVHLDREQLRQVLLNCLLNAVDAIRSHQAEEGVITLATRLEAPAGADHPARLRISLTDNGSGIPAELRESVFDPFFTTKEPGRGTGLGLWVSLSLIESMGGAIRLESEPGAGTTVHLLLPLTDPADPPAPAHPPEPGA